MTAAPSITPPLHLELDLSCYDISAIARRTPMAENLPWSSTISLRVTLLTSIG